MASFVDERAPGVSSAMRNRIAAALAAGTVPTVQGKNLKLGPITLQFADGRAAPALREVELQMGRRNIPIDNAFDTFEPSTTMRGRSTYATDRAGREHIIARRVGDVNKVTKAGRRFYQNTYTRYIVKIPTYYMRISTEQRFREDSYDMTGDQMGFGRRQQVRGTPEEQLRELNAAYDDWLANYQDTLVKMSDMDDDDVDIFVDETRRPTFHIQTQHIRDGALTADTLLNRVVFGAPILAEDMWQLHRIHEVSRRRNGQCGLDVIVASATQRHGTNRQRQPMMTAEQAAQKLVELARAMDPDGALATHAIFDDVPQTAEITGIDEDLRLRAPDVACLEQFKPGMLAFLATARSVQDVQRAAEKQHIWRRNFAVETSFAATLRQAFPWCKTPRTRLLLCLRAWGVYVAGEQVTLQKPAASNAVECICKFGTPVRLLEAYYRSLDVKLVLMNGSRCAHIWQPPDWEQRYKDARVTVVLNIWNDHVWAYDAETGRNAPSVCDDKEWAEDLLLTPKQEEDAHDYDSMVELSWPLLLEAWHDKRKAVFWTTAAIESLEKELHDNSLAFVPHYSAPSECSFVDVPFSDGKHRQHIRIRRVPKDHVQLREFCEQVQTQLHLKLYYKGESPAVLGHRFVQEFLVKKREALSCADVAALKERQQNRCAKCRDLLSRWEAHHDVPVADGGGRENIVLVCPT